mmetsp:Transcript_26386/g.54757  ORF Transcript_26386/g.54757 Transcript_26386/m.54757 type:complete len:248 (+) Transcript_26386:1513-2256(+)
MRRHAGRGIVRPEQHQQLPAAVPFLRPAVDDQLRDRLLHDGHRRRGGDPLLQHRQAHQEPRPRAQVAEDGGALPLGLHRLRLHGDCHRAAHPRDPGLPGPQEQEDAGRQHSGEVPVQVPRLLPVVLREVHQVHRHVRVHHGGHEGQVLLPRCRRGGDAAHQEPVASRRPQRHFRLPVRAGQAHHHGGVRHAVLPVDRQRLDVQQRREGAVRVLGAGAADHHPVVCYRRRLHERAWPCHRHHPAVLLR